ncbi:hypothetical protein [Streptomyces xanthochromogenes]|uniref:hypothetical protein n=1 Tax=Streptomyces xanthochromogenes TaxID=67384 RepID=UPI002F42E116
MVAGDLHSVRPYRPDLEAAVAPPVALAAGDDKAAARRLKFFGPRDEYAGSGLGQGPLGRVDQVAVPGDRFGQDFPFWDFVLVPVCCEVEELGRSRRGREVSMQSADC